MTQQDQTPRLINSSASKEVEEVVTWLKSSADVMSRIGQVSMCFRSDMVNFRQAADLLTCLSAERDRLEGERDGLIGAVADHVSMRGFYYDRMQENAARAERAEAERDALKSPPEDVLERMARAFISSWFSTEPAALEAILREGDQKEAISAMRAALREVSQ